ncbi:hypothetical protein SAMN02799631_02161 [Methylobacterium sp. 174MFSha1.1]|nr:hypothetical protein SAMN02799631_02161 [Methylobacterium sp. 174MFSha1.1]
MPTSTQWAGDVESGQMPSLRSACSRDEIRRTVAVGRDETGNLLALPLIFPDRTASGLHVADWKRVLTTMRRGCPPPEVGTLPAVHGRNVASPYRPPSSPPRRGCLVIGRMERQPQAA